MGKPVEEVMWSGVNRYLIKLIRLMKIRLIRTHITILTAEDGRMELRPRGKWFQEKLAQDHAGKDQDFSVLRVDDILCVSEWSSLHWQLT